MRIIGTAKICGACGRATIGTTHWCPFCTSECFGMKDTDPCQEEYEPEVRFFQGRLVIFGNKR